MPISMAASLPCKRPASTLLGSLDLLGLSSSCLFGCVGALCIMMNLLISGRLRAICEAFFTIIFYLECDLPSWFLSKKAESPRDLSCLVGHDMKLLITFFIRVFDFDPEFFKINGFEQVRFCSCIFIKGEGKRGILINLK